MAKSWIIESYFGNAQDSLARIPLKNLPLKVGRDSSLTLAIPRSEVSREHAEFYMSGNDLCIRDLNSTNGTFINNQQLKGFRTLRHGDVLHFANYEARVLEDENDDSSSEKTTSQTTTFNAITDQQLHQQFHQKLPKGLFELDQLIKGRAVQGFFQPIVSASGELFGHELLGRGNMAEFPVSPLDLFRIAESSPGKDVELSELFRAVGVPMGFSQKPVLPLFMNTHPVEMKNIRRLLLSMESLRKKYPDLPIVMEIHEDASADLPTLKKFAEELAILNIELAYDDFGSGQARLMEMTEVSVQYVKFDISLIRNIHTAPASKQKMVGALVAMTKSLGILTLAEGVEGMDEFEWCKAANFDLYQGYFFGKPQKDMDYQNIFKRRV